MIDLDPKLAEALDQHTPHVDEDGDWNQVLLDGGAARRWAINRRRRHALVAAFAALAVTALIGVVPALAGKGYFWSGGQPTFPHNGVASEKSTVAVFHPKGQGPVVVTAAPNKPGTLAGPGICYLFSGLSGGCSTRSPHGSGLTWPGARDDLLYGYTFDARVVAATLTYPNGKQVAVPVVRAKAPISTVFFLAQAPVNPSALVLKGGNGQTISRIPYQRLPRRHP
jgi:hypothetical protein